VKETQLQIPLPGVPQAKQGREVPQRWAWTEASVWTERMVATLERGIKGGKWYSLIDKVWKLENLQSAARQVKANGGAAGVDGLSCKAYFQHTAPRLQRLQDRLQKDLYQPSPVRRVWIPKLGSKELRPLGVPTVESRVVETAVRNVIEPIFEHTFAEHSYGFRPGRGAKDALRRVDKLLKAGKVWVVDADLKGYFDTIPQRPLMVLVEEKISDSRLLALMWKMLKQGVMETAKGWTPTKQGTPQGAVISPLLANIYLNPLDQMMARQGKEMVRYADDFVILCESRAEAEEVLRQLRQWVEAAGLTLHPVKTRIVDASQKGGFDFLGYHFERGRRWPRQKSRDKFRESIRPKTRRHDPRPMLQIIADVNRTLWGWFNYFQHSIRHIFKAEDGWVRNRLRSIERKRHKGTGRARGRDFQRWPNAYFAPLGLFSLARARAEASHVRMRTH
jgi:RNA-directed DNA polymerase